MLPIHIVLPIDDSDASKAAYQIAKRVIEAESKDSSITPIHIWGDWEPYTHDVLFPFAPLDGLLEDLEYEVSQAAHHCIDDWLGVKGQERPAFLSSNKIYRGHRLKHIVKAVTKQSYDMVSMGAFGNSKGVGNLPSSLVLRVAEATRVPLIVARPVPNPGRLEKILVAIDLTTHSLKLVQNAVRLAERVGASLRLLYVVPDPLVHEKSELSRSLVGFEHEVGNETLQKKIQQTLEHLIRETHFDYPVKDDAVGLVSEIRVRIGDPVDEIIAEAVETRSQMILLGKCDPSRESYRPLGSTALKLLIKSPVHLMLDTRFVDHD